MTSEFLREVPEAAADGTIDEVYRDIRRVFGLPLVNLVYRYLATFPGVLEDAWWRDLRLNLRSAVVAELAPALAEAGSIDPSVPIPPTALAAVGVDAVEADRVRSTLDVYARANIRNLVGVIALLDGALGTAHDAGDIDARELEPTDEPLPMGELSRLDPPVLALLEEMGSAIAGPGESVFVPSLFRHFSHRPALLSLFWTILRPATLDGTLEQGARRVDATARDLASRLPFPVSPIVAADARQGLERFAVAIPRMIVVEGVLRRSLAEIAFR